MGKKRGRILGEGGLTCRGERASLSRRRESSRLASLRLSEADSNNRLQGWREDGECVCLIVCVFKESAGSKEVSPLISLQSGSITTSSSSSSSILVLSLGEGLVQLTSVLLQSSDFESPSKNESAGKLALEKCWVIRTVTDSWQCSVQQLSRQLNLFWKFI